MPRSTLAPRTICAALASACALVQGAPTPPPVAAVKPVAEAYFGTTVTDVYRYMEDLASPEVRQWSRAQSDHARSVLDAIPGRAALASRIAALDASASPRVEQVRRTAGGLVFYEKRGGNEDQAGLYVRNGFQGAERRLVDPQALAKATGVAQAIDFHEPSPDGRFVAYGLSPAGSEETVIHVLDVASGKELAPPIDRAQRGYVHWMPDGGGFVYLRQRTLPAGAPARETYQGATAFFHRMAGRGADLALLQAGSAGHLRIGPGEMPVVSPLAGSRWAVAVPAHGAEREIDLYAAPTARLLDPKLPWRKVFGRDAGITGFAVHGDDLYLLSHLNASRYKVMRTSLAHPDLALANVVVAPGAEVVDRIVAAQDALYVQVHDGSTGRLYRVGYGADDQPEPVALPAAGAVSILDAGVAQPGVIVAVASWTQERAIYAVGAKGAPVVDTGLQAAGSGGAPADLVAEEVLVKSQDGLDVPLSIVHRQDMKRDGGNALELRAYGAHGVTDTPRFEQHQLAWHELGGVLATCHVRGGGIYGEQWHLAGQRLTKANSWQDLVACGEYLVKNGYTSPSKMAIAGRGAGAIAVGRAMTTRPELWAAVVSDAGALDMVRAETTAGGALDIPEFGTVADRRQFDGLMEMDAFHHVADGVPYPATLLLHAFDDPRVPAWASMKMAARLQAATTFGKPVLLRVQADGGHGGGSTRSQREAQDADRWSFMLWQSGDPRFQP